MLYCYIYISTWVFLWITIAFLSREVARLLTFIDINQYPVLIQLFGRRPCINNWHQSSTIYGGGSYYFPNENICCLLKVVRRFPELFLYKMIFFNCCISVTFVWLYWRWYRGPSHLSPRKAVKMSHRTGHAMHNLNLESLATGESGVRIVAKGNLTWATW